MKIFVKHVPGMCLRKGLLRMFEGILNLLLIEGVSESPWGELYEVFYLF